MFPSEGHGLMGKSLNGGKMKKVLTSAVLLGVVALALAGCTGSSSVTVTATVTEVITSPPVAPGSPAPSPVTSEAPEVAPAPEPDVVVVTDMVGQNYQDAQDVWRASGLVVLPAEDATGANRLAMLDSNWYVVAQTPKGGTEVPPGSSIQATIKKYSDD